jgi:arylsulfatase A-like enzyme
VALRALVALAFATAALAGTAHAADAPRAVESSLVEVAHLIAPHPGTPLPTYTLGDETRPLLAGPTEATVQLVVPPNAGDQFAFDVPASVAPGAVIATGIYANAKRSFPFAPTRLTVEDAGGAHRATLVVPGLARASGAATRMALTLTTPPAADVVETEAAIGPSQRGAALRFAYALSEAAGMPGGGAITLEVATREPAARAPLWSAVVDASKPETHRWREASVPLDALGGRPARLVFRARAGEGGRAALLPLWADPTVAAPMPRAPKHRNVVLISIDTLRADRLGVYGSYRPTTPAIDAFAREAVVFDEAWSVWPETSGSHMSLFTSRFPSEHGVTSFVTVPPTSIRLLAEHLRAAGYLTRAFTEDGGVWANAGFARGFSAYGERRSPTFVYPGEAAATFADATHWIESNRDRTFFLFVHTYQVHAPYVPPRAYRTLFADIPGREPFGHDRHALAYDRETRFTDDQVGPFLAAVRRLGLADQTLVVLLSDHGEEFGEHGGMGHGRTLYRELLHVPLIMWAPGLLAPKRITTPVSLLDVAPTLLDLLGLTPDPGYRGISLAAAARGRAAPPSRPLFGEVDRDDLIAHDHVRAVCIRRAGRTAITNLMDGTTRCYAADDPAEQHPLADCTDLREVLAARAADRSRPGAATPVPPDPRTIEKMRALGYVE